MKTIYLEKNDIHCTLTTYLYCNFWMMWAAEQLGHIAYISWFQNGGSVLSYNDNEMFRQNPNMFEWYFEQPLVTRSLARREETWTFEGWRDPSPSHFVNQPLSVIKEYYQRHLKFNDATNARGQALVDKYKIDFLKTIGITWRGTDGRTDGRIRMPIEKYFPWIDQVLTPDMRIMCTAEETEILNPLFERYGSQAFFVEEFIQAPHGSKDNPERFSPVSGYERGLQPALMVWLFSKCAHYIKNRASTAAVASWLSRGRIVNIAHEETLSYVKMDDQVEIEGVKYPL